MCDATRPMRDFTPDEPAGELRGRDGGGAPAGACALPTAFRWTSSGILIPPISDSAHDLISVKDPTVVFFHGRWHVYATTASHSGGGWNMFYLGFTDWSEAAAAKPYYMEATPGFSGYRCAPQLFYFTPQEKWYLVYQSGPPMYSTADDPSKPDTWTAPTPFFPSEPSIITANGGWLDFWIICDDVHCHMFSSDDKGRLYRSQTTIGCFPNGFGDPVIVMQNLTDPYSLYEASNVYKVKGKNQYLLLVEALGGTKGRRYFRSWTATSLSGSWTPLADTWASPFAGQSNVTFAAGVTPWTEDVSHGEMLRDGYDETLTIDARKLQYLFQGIDPKKTSLPYYDLPYRLGLLTQAP
jgi:hypothetical protein